MFSIKDVVEFVQQFTRPLTLLAAVFWIIVLDGLLAYDGAGLLYWLKYPMKDLPSLVLDLPVDRVLFAALLGAFLWLIGLPTLGALWDFIRSKLPGYVSGNHPGRKKGFVSLLEAKRLAAETNNSVLNERCLLREKQNDHDDRLRQLILALPIAALATYFTSVDSSVTVTAEFVSWVGNLWWLTQALVLLISAALSAFACIVLGQADLPMRYVIWLEDNDKGGSAIPLRYRAKSSEASVKPTAD